MKRGILLALAFVLLMVSGGVAQELPRISLAVEGGSLTLPNPSVTYPRNRVCEMRFNTQYHQNKPQFLVASDYKLFESA